MTSEIDIAQREAYRLRGGLLLDIQEGQGIGLLNVHAPEIASLVTRATVGPECDTVTLAALPEAEPGSPDATDRLLTFQELDELALTARGICQQHYQPVERPTE